ncbi:MAG: membrane integrity-associated transporter subunit PqiC [Alphaproteobacteria bacterium]|nr:membrane integrity-associated transporter subunit PqiC [Alphaproteobacteria bacterium]
MKRRALFLALPAGLGACSSILPGQGDPAQLYTLTPKNTFADDLPRVAWQLVVDPPVAAAGLNTSRIALQRTPVSLDYYAKANWTDSAPLMVQTLLIESFENTGKIVAVARESVRLRPDYLLQTELREFQAEYFPEPRQPPQVRARIIAKLVRVVDRSIIASTAFERAERAARDDMVAIAEAFDEALGGVMKRIVEWTLRAPGSGARPPQVPG